MADELQIDCCHAPETDTVIFRFGPLKGSVVMDRDGETVYMRDTATVRKLAVWLLEAADTLDKGIK